MQYTLDLSGYEFQEEFIPYLLRFLQKKMLLMVKYPNREETLLLNNWEELIKAEESKIKLPETISLRKVLIMGINNLMYTNSGNIYHFQVDTATKIPMTFLSVNRICSMVDQGTLGNKGCRIFSEAFDYAKKHIQEIVSLFENGFD